MTLEREARSHEVNCLQGPSQADAEQEQGPSILIPYTANQQKILTTRRQTSGSSSPTAGSATKQNKSQEGGGGGWRGGSVVKHL